jgi:hypothetical protein
MGLTTKEQMLKELKVATGPDMTRVEKGLAQYVLSIMLIPEVPTDGGVRYFSDLLVLDQVIPWDKIGVRSGVTAGIGSL